MTAVQVPLCAVCLLRVSFIRKEGSFTLRLLFVPRGAEIGPTASKPRLDGVEVVEVQLKKLFDGGER